MRQKLILLVLALFCSIGAWAIDVKIANTSSGLPSAATSRQNHLVSSRSTSSLMMQQA